MCGFQMKKFKCNKCGGNAMWIRVNLVNANDTILYGMRKTLPTNLQARYWYTPKPETSSVFVECCDCNKIYGPRNNLEELEILLKENQVLK
jgi:hypothetical protein